jgi:hypothetical protein
MPNVLDLQNLETDLAWDRNDGGFGWGTSCSTGSCSIYHMDGFVE